MRFSTSSETVPEKIKFGNCFGYAVHEKYGIMVIEVIPMRMLGDELHSLQDFKHHFSIDEIIYSYYSGELAVFLNSIGENEIAQKLDGIPHNGWILVKLYELFGLNPELTEEVIRKPY